METIIGLIMFYTWIHSVVIIVKKTIGTTGYEQTVMIAGAVGLGLFIIGSIA